MASDIRIAKATEADIEDLIAIFVDASEYDIISRFMFGHRREEAVNKQTEFFTPVLRRSLTHPTNQCLVLKAMDSQTREVLGWTLVRWEDGKPVKPPESVPGQPDFLMYYWREQDKNWRKLTAGKKHVGMWAVLLHTSRHTQSSFQCSKVCM